MDYASAAPSSYRLKNGRVPSWMSTKPGAAAPAMPPMPANLVPMVDDTSNTKGAELQAQEAEVLRDHMESIRNRLKLEREFEGIDPFAIADDDIERAMELGVLPVPMIADYVKDMWELARLRALGHPLPLWVVRFIEAVLVLQRWGPAVGHPGRWPTFGVSPFALLPGMWLCVLRLHVSLSTRWGVCGDAWQALAEAQVETVQGAQASGGQSLQPRKNQTLVGHNHDAAVGEQQAGGAAHTEFARAPLGWKGEPQGLGGPETVPRQDGAKMEQVGAAQQSQRRGQLYYFYHTRVSMPARVYHSICATVAVWRHLHRHRGKHPCKALAAQAVVIELFEKSPLYRAFFAPPMLRVQPPPIQASPAAAAGFACDNGRHAHGHRSLAGQCCLGHHDW
mmetsp:Transcript_43075/g.107865  ORF Transcript_43075/g.107865 Transcript_43075/m.107865 type:complete len:393 (-) Transcript_43075:453-1631(-)